MGSTTILSLLAFVVVAHAADTTNLGVAVIFESQKYADDVASTFNWLLPKGTVQIRVCPESNNCTIPEPWDQVIAAVGRVLSELYPKLSGLRLVQSASYMYPTLETVPDKATVANFAAGYDVEAIAEFVIAGTFDWQYRLAERSTVFTECAWSADAPKHCPPASELTNHDTLMDKTMGVVGLGRIGSAVAKRSTALGMRTIASKTHAPFTSDYNLSWIGDDNDKIVRESDFVVVTVPGSVIDLINATAIKLMKPGAVLIPVSAGPVDYEALRVALADDRIGAVVDVWDEGCWHYPDYTCGAPYGKPSFPHHEKLDDTAGRVRSLPGMAMRSSRFWKASATAVAENIAALAIGNPLTGVVRAGSTSISV